MPQNYYKSDRIKKKLPKLNDHQLEFTGCPINKHILLCGGTGSGKTNCLYDYIIQTSKPKQGTFKKILVCYKTDEILYDDLKEQLGDGILFFKSVEEFPSVDEFKDAIDTDYKEQYLICFDDCIHNKDKASYLKIMNYFTYGRKKGLTIIYLSQSFFDSDSFIRKQMSYLILLENKGRTDLNNILREYGGLQVEKNELYKIAKYALTPDENDELPFLKITTGKCSDDKKFSKGWLNYIPFTPKT